MTNTITSLLNFIKKHKTFCVLAVCFLLPAIIITGFYALSGMYPFGDKSVLIMDMSNQYVEFFAGLKNIARRESSVFFSWSKYLGSNFIGLFTYYISSPLSMITIFFPERFFLLGLMILNILKVSLTGLTMGIFIKKAIRPSLYSIPIFATAYALSAYAVAYSMSIMWLDSMIYLPLILLGVEYILEKDKSILFATALTLNIFSNYYTAYMTTVFSGLYFVYRYIQISENLSFRKLFKKIGIYAFTALMAAGINAVILIPSYSDLLSGRIATTFSVFKITSVADIFVKLLPGAYDTIQYAGLPNIFCTIFVVMLFVCYFYIKSFSIKNKIATVCVTIFMLISFYLPSLNVAWHIFSEPQWFPFRYSFVFSFFIVYIAAITFTKIKEIPIYAVISAAAAVILIALFGYSNYDFVKLKILIITICLALTYTALMRSFFKNNKKLLICVTLIMLLTSMEVFYNGRETIKGLADEFSYKSYSSYTDFKTILKPIINDIKKQDSSFYRIEKTFDRSKNDAIGLGTSSITHFSSAYSGDFNKFASQAGFLQDWFWTDYTGATVLTDALFGVKYRLSQYDNGIYTNHGGDYFIEDFLDINTNRIEDLLFNLYENQYALSPAYMVKNDILDIESYKGYNDIDTQNRLIGYMLGKNINVFEKIESQEPYFTNESTIKNYQYTTLSDGTYYITVNKPSQGKYPAVYINGIKSGVYKHIIPLYDYNAGQRLILSLYEPGADSDIILYKLNVPVFEAVVDELRKSQLEVTAHGTDYINGKITVAAQDNKTLMMTSIPYDKGWNVLVDGKKVEATSFDKGLLCVELTDGEHNIKMKYHVPWLKTGAIISICCFMLLCGFFVWMKFKKAE